MFVQNDICAHFIKGSWLEINLMCNVFFQKRLSDIYEIIFQLKFQIFIPFIIHARGDLSVNFEEYH